MSDFKLDKSAEEINTIQNNAVYPIYSLKENNQHCIVWSNGYCEQWGVVYDNATITKWKSVATSPIQLLVPYADKEYCILLSANYSAAKSYWANVRRIPIGVTQKSFCVKVWNEGDQTTGAGVMNTTWYTKGQVSNETLEQLINK